LVEITKAIATDANLIVMDEPTASLSDEECKKLFAIVRDLKQNNVTVLYISHRLSEVFELGDDVTVLRDGKVIGTRPVSDIPSPQDLIKMMIGKAVTEAYTPSPVNYARKVLEVSGFTNDRLQNISFDLHEGEILGVYGLIGSGKTEIARAIYGVDRAAGTLELFGRRIGIRTVRGAIRNGVSMVPEERRSQGLFSALAIRENIPLMNMRKVSRWGTTVTKRIREIADRFIRELRIVCRNGDQTVALLSGGNQQKVVVAKCLNADARILLLDEPTRGVDVGAKEEIHNVIRRLSHRGVSSIVFSSELPEILSLCDRIILLYGGRIRAILRNGPECDSQRIMHIVTGGEG
jgi:ABC-type sugar transport system ATPase subunit